MADQVLDILVRARNEVSANVAAAEASVARLTDRLKEQAATAGMTSNQIAVYKIRLQEAAAQAELSKLRPGGGKADLLGGEMGEEDVAGVQAYTEAKARVERLARDRMAVETRVRRVELAKQLREEQAQRLAVEQDTLQKEMALRRSSWDGGGGGGMGGGGAVNIGRSSMLQFAGVAIAAQVVGNTLRSMYADVRKEIEAVTAENENLAGSIIRVGSAAVSSLPVVGGVYEAFYNLGKDLGEEIWGEAANKRAAAALDERSAQMQKALDLNKEFVKSNADRTRGYDEDERRAEAARSSDPVILQTLEARIKAERDLAAVAADRRKVEDNAASMHPQMVKDRLAALDAEAAKIESIREAELARIQAKPTEDLLHRLYEEQRAIGKTSVELEAARIHTLNLSAADEQFALSILHTNEALAEGQDAIRAAGDLAQKYADEAAARDKAPREVELQKMIEQVEEMTDPAQREEARAKVREAEAAARDLDRADVLDYNQRLADELAQARIDAMGDEWDRRRAQLDREYSRELEDAKKHNADRALVDETYAVKRQQLLDEKAAADAAALEKEAAKLARHGGAVPGVPAARVADEFRFLVGEQGPARDPTAAKTESNTKRTADAVDRMAKVSEVQLDILRKLGASAASQSFINLSMN